MEREIISTKVRVKMDEFNQEKAQISFDYYIGPMMDESARELCEAIPLAYLTPSAIPAAPVSKTQSRSVTSNVATIKTQSEHFLKVGDAAVVAGMGGTGYNVSHTVTVVPDPRTFKAALTHADELETGDSGGTVTAPSAVLIFVSADKKTYIPVPGDYLRLYEIKFPSWIVPVREAAKIDSPEGKMQDNPYLSAGKGRPAVMIKNMIPTGGVYGKFFVCGRCELSETPSAYYVKAPLAEEVSEKLIDALTWLAASKMFIVNAMGDKAKPCYEQYVLSVQSLSKT